MMWKIFSISLVLSFVRCHFAYVRETMSNGERIVVDFNSPFHFACHTTARRSISVHFLDISFAEEECT